MTTISVGTTNSKFYELPEFVMDQVLCSNCTNFLSVPPIYSLHNGDVVCGRCVDLKCPQGTRNKLYEILLEFLSFPCMNKQYGCLESRPGKSMWGHEICCFYRRINCPLTLTKGCDWVGDTENILEHFEKNHSMHLLNEPSFEVNFLHNFEDICILPYSESLFLVRRHGDTEKNKFWCSVQSIQRNEFEKFKYSLTLKNPVSGKCKRIDEKPVESLNDQDGFEIESSDVQDYLENPLTIIATIEIMYQIETNESETKTESLSDTDLKMLKVIECPVCFEHMVPPIYQCEIGHSICEGCKSKMKQCPTCERPFGDAKNYAVADITSFIKYPCKHSVKGCKSILSAKTKKQHESTCNYRSFTCPTSDYTSCLWSGLKDHIWEHCKQKHRDNIIECSCVSIPFYPSEENEDDDCFIINYMSNIFILHWKYSEKIFYWSVQLVGQSEHSKDYYFDLDIIDRTGKNLRIFMRHTCEILTSKEMAFEDSTSFLFLTLDQVKPLINEVFSFKPTIFKCPSINSV